MSTLTPLPFACIISAVTFAAAIGRSGHAPQSFSESDRQAVVAVTQAYRDGWQANDSRRVMATLTFDAVLLPSNMRPIVGEHAIRSFWFPAAPITTVTAMEQTVTDVVGAGDRAVVTGRGSLTFRIDAGQSRTQHSWFANVMNRQPDGRWLITRRMWVDLAAP